MHCDFASYPDTIQGDATKWVRFVIRPGTGQLRNIRSTRTWKRLTAVDRTTGTTEEGERKNLNHEEHEAHEDRQRQKGCTTANETADARRKTEAKGNGLYGKRGGSPDCEVTLWKVSVCAFPASSTSRRHAEAPSLEAPNASRRSATPYLPLRLPSCRRAVCVESNEEIPATGGRASHFSSCSGQGAEKGKPQMNADSHGRRPPGLAQQRGAPGEGPHARSAKSTGCPVVHSPALCQRAERLSPNSTFSTVLVRRRRVKEQ